MLLSELPSNIHSIHSSYTMYWFGDNCEISTSNLLIISEIWFSGSRYYLYIQPLQYKLKEFQLDNCRYFTVYMNEEIIFKYY